VLSCPNKQKPLDQRRSDKGHILVHFESETCSQCSMQDRCPVNIGAKISTLTISEEQYAGAARHQQYMEDFDYRQECGIRAGAESLVNEVANGHGARKSRHRTEKRSRLQLIFASIGCNVKRFIRYQVNCVQNQPEMAVSIA
jgi:DDE family transposase